MSGYTIDGLMNRIITGHSVSSLGGGLPGGQPKSGLIGGGAGPNSSSGMEGGSTRGRDRTILRKAFGNSSNADLGETPKKLAEIFASNFEVSSDIVEEVVFPSPLTIATPGCNTACQLWNVTGALDDSYKNIIGGESSMCGQFRAAMNLGDVRVASNTSGGKAPNEFFGNAANPLNGVGKTKIIGDAIHTNTGPSLDYIKNNLGHGQSLSQMYQKHGASYSGNPKFVSDSSDFIRYKKMAAKNRNYNDSSFGGATTQDAVSARARARR